MYTGTTNKGVKGPFEIRTHNRNNLSIKEVPNILFPILLIHFEPLKSRQPLYKAGPNVSFVQRFHADHVLYI